MMQTGRLFTGGINTPHAGCALAYLRGRKTDLPAHVILPEPMGPTGGNLPHGQDAGFLGKAYDPFALMADPSKPNFQGARPAAAGRRSARRGSTGAAACAAIVDETVKQLRSQRQRATAGQQFRGGLPPDDQRRRRARPSTCRKSRRRCASATA